MTASHAASLNDQARCARQAEKFFNEAAYDITEYPVQVNHFNEKVMKCFVGISRQSFSNGWTYETVFDAFEGTSYADYAWHMNKDKYYWEVPPVRCMVKTLDLQSFTRCTSDDEFHDLLLGRFGLDMR
jgi:hypothetical protein